MFLHTIPEQTYLGIQIFRFYFKCTKCSAELTIKTDPQNSDYVVESGAARNFEPWRAEDEVAENEKSKRDAEEMGDAMKSLENRAMDSKQDMDILAALEEMRSMKSRHATVSVDDMLETLKRSAYEKEKKILDEIDKADAAVIQSIVFPGSKDFVRRIEDEDDDDDDLDENIQQPSSSLSHSLDNNLKRKNTSGLQNVVENPTDSLTKASINNSKNAETPGGFSIPKPKFILKPRAAAGVQSNKMPRMEHTDNNQAGDEKQSKSEVENGNQMTNGLLSLCQNYDSDESV